MADGLGLLEAQQSAAARIPYENVQMNQQQAGNAASLFLNAFHIAAQTNAQRQKLEEQLLKSQMDMTFKEQKHEDDMRQMTWMNAYRLQDQERKTQAVESLMGYRNAEEARKVDEFNRKMETKDAESTRIGQYRAKLTSISAEEKPYSQAWWNKVSVAQNEFSDLGKPGDAAFKDFEINARAAVNSAHRAADLMGKNFDRTVQMTGSSVTRNDFLQPDAAWLSGKDQQGNPTRYLAKVKEVDPATKTFSYRVLGAKEKAEREKKGEKLRYDTLNSNTYNSLREMHGSMMDVGGTDVKDKPAWIDPSAETVRSVGQRKAVFNSQTKEFIRWADE